MDYALAIDLVMPGADWRRADNYQALVDTWKDDRPVPTDQELIDAYDAHVAAAPPKTWASASEFLDEFTLQEKTDIANSPTVAGLALDLAAWVGEVRSNAERLVAGMDARVAAGILTPERKEEVLNG